MTNEDAIKWLDNLRNDLGNPHYECLWPYAQALDEIGEMMEEKNETTFEKDGHHIRCVKCNSYWCITDREGNAFPMNYCPECGRKAVKWDETL